MARQLSRVSNEIDLREMRRFGGYFYRVAPALVAAAADAGIRPAMQKYVTAFQLPRSSVGMNYLELGIAAEEMKLWIEQNRGKFTLQGMARLDQFLAKHDAIMQGSPTWQRLTALATRPEATFERSQPARRPWRSRSSPRSETSARSSSAPTSRCIWDSGCARPKSWCRRSRMVRRTQRLVRHGRARLRVRHPRHPAVHGEEHRAEHRSGAQSSRAACRMARRRGRRSPPRSRSSG